MTDRKRSSTLTVWVLAALVLIGAGCNASPAFAETIFYAYDDLNRLTAVEVPDAGASRFEYDEVGNRLSKTFAPNVCVPVCPAGFTREDNMCHQPAGCPGGALNAQYDLCFHDIQFGCPAGYAYVAERSRCEGTPVCTEGSYYATNNRCYKPVNKSCAAGYTYAAARDRCEAAPSCWTGGSYSKANNRCEAPCTYSYICSLDDTESGGWNSGRTYADYDTCASNCSQTTACTSKVDPVSGSEVYTCPYGAENTCDGSHNCTRTGTCSAKTPCSCPIGYSWNGATCVVRATCSQGNLDGDNDVCYRSYIKSCDSGWSYVIGVGVCSQGASCPSGGTYKSTYDVCQINSTAGCASGYTWDPATSLCSMPPQCPAGSSYSTAHDRCETAAISCP